MISEWRRRHYFETDRMWHFLEVIKWNRQHFFLRNRNMGHFLLTARIQKQLLHLINFLLCSIVRLYRGGKPQSPLLKCRCSVSFELWNLLCNYRIMFHLIKAEHKKDLILFCIIFGMVGFFKGISWFLWILVWNQIHFSM